MRPEEVARDLRRLGIRASRRLGQHFLIDERVARRQVDRAGLKGNETVLEIGPGLGVLTRILIERAGKVIAIEKDGRLAAALRDLGPRVDLITGDALKTDWPKFDVMVSNLPYRISSPVTFRLLERQFDRAVLMFQREFAARMVARPGTSDYSRLTVGVANRADCELLERVPRSAFHPQPRVESAIVRVTPREPPYRLVDPRTFDSVVAACFQHRRKTLRNALELEWQRFGADLNAWRRRVAELPFLERRAEALSPEEFASLANDIAGAKG